MPLVKTSIKLVSNDLSLVDPDRHCAVLVELCRQIGELANGCEILVAELTSEVESIAGRTQSLIARASRLAVKVESLNADNDHPSATPASSSQLTDKTLVRRNSVTDYKSRGRRSLFTASTRPHSIRASYQDCMTSPADIISQCDIYRTDGRRGALIFSPSVFFLREQAPDDFLTVNKTSTMRRTLGRSVKSLRPSNRTRPNSLALTSSSCLPSAPVDLLPAVDDVIEHRVEPETVCVDVSGSNFIRQVAAKLYSPIIEDGTLGDRKRLSSWRRTICDVTELVFDEFDADSRLFETSDVRRQLTVKQHKAKRIPCRWRQSLKTLMRGVRSKSTDLWADYSTLSPQTLQRSNSLPKSLKTAVNQEQFGGVVKSKSVECRMSMLIEGTTKPEVLGIHSATLSRSRGSLTDRSRGRPKSMEVHIKLVEEKKDEEIVHVNIPEQPWTKPFANVRLRTRTTRAESEKYQSSSGHWSAEHSFDGETQRSSMTSFASCHGNDSAVSLSCDVMDRVAVSDITSQEKFMSTNTLLLQDILRTMKLNTISTSHLSFSTFKPSFGDVMCETDRENHVIRTKPSPPDRTSSALALSLTLATPLDTSSAQSTEIEKLTSLVKKFAAGKAGGGKTLNLENLQRFSPFQTIPPPNDVTKRPATTSLSSSNKKITSATRNSPRDVTLSLIDEGSDETDECNSERVTSSSATWPRHVITQDDVIDEESIEGDSLTPVSARLIISSPLASRASFVDNPHKRSMCHPISPSSRDTELTSDNPQCSGEVNDSCKFISSVLPTNIVKSTVPSNYGRSWYDGVQETESPNDVSNRLATTGSSLAEHHVIDVDTQFVNKSQDNFAGTEMTSETIAGDNVEGKRPEVVVAKRRSSTSGSFAVRSVKQHKARAVKTSRSVSGCDKLSTYNVIAATYKRINELNGVTTLT